MADFWAWFDTVSFWDWFGLCLLFSIAWSVLVGGVRTLGRAWRDEPRAEWHCPSCGAVTRARMADREETTRG